MHIIDLSYYYSAHISDPDVLLNNHRPNMGYVQYLPEGCRVSVIKFLNFEGKQVKDDVAYYFFKGSKAPFWIPYAIHQFIRQLQPDVVLLHGLIYPWQVLWLKKQVGSQVKLIVQHHAESPATGLKTYLQRKADSCIDRYLFTTKELAVPWMEKCIISDEHKIAEMPEGSTDFKKMDKTAAQRLTGISGNNHFLWVGRLDANKDPLTAVTAFLQYAKIHPQSKLYMIYQQDALEKEVQQLLTETDAKNNVILLGQKPYEELRYWYNSVDFFLSGSHKEGSGYALIEAMACGCIPVVTDIPSFRKITAGGTYGLLYQPGSVPALYAQLCTLQKVTKEAYAEAITAYFSQHLSFKSIADTICAVSQSLTQV